MKITFLGATQTVTGSRYLLEEGKARILVDCGLFQGFKELRLRNWAAFPVNPASIDAVVLTHAHLDHSGYLPRLIKEGFHGTVYCTHGTYDLCNILLPDSGHIQEEDAESANRHGYSRHHPALPLYTEEEARVALSYFKPMPYDEAFSVGNGFECTFYRAGHILGASLVHIAGKKKSVTFSGDVGRMNDAVMKAPDLLPACDALVIESTYGDRRHDNADPGRQLSEIINLTVGRGGTVIIPAFAVGRVQSILYYLYKLKSDGRLARDLPVYLDSPMSISASELLKRHLGDHRLPAPLCAAVCNTATYVHTPDESRALSQNTMPKVIISASGMATGGRVLHHLKHYLGDWRNTVLLVGHQVAGTRGDRLIRGEKEIKIHGAYYPVQAEVRKIESLSAHADFEELLDWLGKSPIQPETVYVTHGEASAAQAMGQKIRQRFSWPTFVPDFHETRSI
ncbi:MAG: MBL fold metallo-hydrolase RNA specificity domain-containing protein [Bdellovibrionales bacterium]